MKTNTCLYFEYTFDIPYEVYTSKTSNLYGKIIHETNTIKIYNKLQIVKEYNGYLNVVDIDDNRTIGSNDIGDISNESNQSLLNTYDIDSIDLEFEINDIEDLNDAMPYIK